jgi:hypothetical protein
MMMATTEERIARIYEEHRAARESIAANRDLTRDAKVRQLALNDGSQRERLAALQAEVESARADELATLERRFFSPPMLGFMTTTSDRVATNIAHRDAIERARRYADSPEATSMADFIRDAVRNGDEGLAKAGLGIAIERRDVPGLNAWVETHSSDEAALQRLVDLRAESTVDAQIRSAIQFAPV